MNKGFLVLEDGRVLTGHTSLTNNVLGHVQFNDHSATLKANTDQHIFKLDQAHKTDGQLFVGKIVIDALPMDFHMYDVKNAVL